MKKIISGFLALMLATSMFFAIAPQIIADELSSEGLTSEQTLQAQSINPADQGNPGNPDNSGNPGGPDGPGNPGNSGTPGNPGNSGNTGNPGDPGTTDPTNPDTTDPTNPGNPNKPAPSAQEKLLALIDLGKALEDLRIALRQADGASVICTDSTTIGEDKLLASFRESDPLNKVLALVNKINKLLEVCGLPYSPQQFALPIAVVGDLPDGFSFANNTLLLADTDTLSWNADLGDEPHALTRSFELSLFLSTGSAYIDSRLTAGELSALKIETFVVTLELINLPGGDDKPLFGVGAPPATEKTVAPSATAMEPAPESWTGEAVTIPVPPTPRTSTITEEQLIEQQEIPQASMMIDDKGNLIAVNAGLVFLSLIMCVSALVSLRQRMSDTSLIASSTATLSTAALAMGVANIVLGVVSTSLLILSQYLDSSLHNSSISWTPILVAIAIVQLACIIGLFANVRSTQKRARRTHFKIRY
ncbi:MAG: hypothetical protein LBP91_01370 [Coriobacteriales bacterium]|nr:hypothetical protein [Coriobacteriales bacterium]